MTLIVMAFRTTKKDSLKYLFTILGVLSPFMHLLALPGQEGILHWKWMSSFLNAFGWALLPIFVGLVMFMDAVNKPQRFRAFLVTSIGVYYVIYIFLPNGNNFDFTPTTYYITVAIFAMLLTHLTVMCFRFDRSKLNHYRHIIKRFVTFTHSETDSKGWIKEEFSYEHNKGRHEIANELISDEL